MKYQMLHYITLLHLHLIGYLNQSKFNGIYSTQSLKHINNNCYLIFNKSSDDCLYNLIPAQCSILYSTGHVFLAEYSNIKPSI